MKTQQASETAADFRARRSEKDGVFGVARPSIVLHWGTGSSPVAARVDAAGHEFESSWRLVKFTEGMYPEISS